MAIEDHILRIRVESNASDELNEAADAADNVSGAQDRAGASAEGFADRAAKAVAVITALKAVVVDSVNAYAELDAAQGRLQSSFASSGASADAFARSQAQSRDLLNRFGVSLQDSTEALIALNDASRDQEKAQADLNLAVDIASQEGIELAAATDALAKARRGDIGALAQLNGLNKELVDDLNAIEDEATRQELTFQALSTAYEGLAEENVGLADQQAKVTAQFEDFQAASGQVLTAIGGAGTGLIGSFAELFGVTQDGDRLFEQFTNGLRNFAEAIEEAFDNVGILVTRLDGLLSGLSITEILDQEANLEAFRRARERQRQEEANADQEDAQTRSERLEVIAQQAEDQAEAAGRREAAARARGRRQQEEDAEIDQLLSDIEEESARTSLEAERQLRDTIAQQIIDGNVFEAERLRIINQSLTAKERELALLQLGERFQKAQTTEANRQAAAQKRVADQALAAAQAQITAQQAITNAAIGGAQTLLEQAGVPRAILARAEAGIEFGRGLAALAGNLAFGIPPNPVEAAGHFAAAAALADVPGLLGLNLGSPGGGGGGGATTPAIPAPQTPTFAGAGGDQVESFGFLGADSNGPQTVQIFNDNRGSVNLESSLQTQRRLATSSARSAGLFIRPVGRR